jgi:cbb3-type cytochrome oxidase maturation protein
VTVGSLIIFAASAAGEAGASAPAPVSGVDVALFATVVGSIVLFGGAAVLALGWAFRNGQFDNFDRGSKSIFGPDEPIGEPTDAFPGVKPETHEEVSRS